MKPDLKSYKGIYKTFINLFPEFENDISGWEGDTFKKNTRLIKVNLKNGCYVFFGATKRHEEWVWCCSLTVSDKTKEQYDFEWVE